MKAIILAAGMGSRLRPLTDSVPKCLVRVGGKPILGHQLDSLSECDVLDEILIVAGYRYSDVCDFVQDHLTSVPTRVMMNDHYETTNNMCSLGLALEELAGETVLILNGDVVFSPDVAVKATTMLAPHSLIACDSSVYYDESMKIVVSNDRVVGISKEIAENGASAVSIDLYRFSGDCSSELSKIIRRTIWDMGMRNKWSEVAIDEMLGYRLVKPLDISPSPWVEIDDLEDLRRAEQMFA